MITQWVRAGKDWIALDEHKGVCAFLKCIDSESIIQSVIPPEIVTQTVVEPIQINKGVPEDLKRMAMRSDRLMRMRKIID